MWTMPSTYNKRVQNINAMHVENAAKTDTPCPLPLEQKAEFAGVMPNTVVTSRVIYHNFLKLNATPTPSPSLKKKRLLSKGSYSFTSRGSSTFTAPQFSPGRALVLICRAVSKPSFSRITSQPAAPQALAQTHCPHTTTQLVHNPLLQQVLGGPWPQASYWLRYPLPSPTAAFRPLGVHTD